MEWKEIIEEFCLDITIKGFSKVTVKNYKCKLGNMADFFIGKGIKPLGLKKAHVKELILG